MHYYCAWASNPVKCCFHVWVSFRIIWILNSFILYIVVIWTYIYDYIAFIHINSKKKKKVFHATKNLKNLKNFKKILTQLLNSNSTYFFKILFIHKLQILILFNSSIIYIFYIVKIFIYFYNSSDIYIAFLYIYFICLIFLFFF